MKQSTEDFDGTFVADNGHRRRRFDHELGSYLHARHAGWDIVAVTDVLDLIGDRVGTASLHLSPQPDGGLTVTITYQLPAPEQ